MQSKIQEFHDAFPVRTFPGQARDSANAVSPKLFIVPPANNVKDGTSFDWESLKWQTWLRIVGYEHTEDPSLDFDASPSGSFPALLADGSIATGKGIAQLAAQRVDVGSATDGVSVVEQADLHAWLAVMETTLAYAVTYHFYLIPDNFTDVVEPLYESRYSYPLSFVLSSSLKTSKTNWLSSRRGVIDRSTIYAEVRQALSAMSDRLGNAAYFGKAPSMADATLFALLHPVLSLALPDVQLGKIVRDFDNLVQHSRRMLAHFPINSS